MKKGVDKHWTPGNELQFEEHIKRCRTFAERHLLMTARDVLKYDGRSKEGKRVMTQARLRLAVACDKDLEELAELQVLSERETGEIPGLHRVILVAKNLGRLKSTRAEIMKKGINEGEL